MANYISFHPKDHFNNINYSGTGADHALTGVGFQPDFTWCKSTSATEWHNLFDSARGVTKAVYTNDTSAEDTTAELLKSFDSDGFTMGNNNNVNGSGKKYRAYNWKMGTSSGIATNGSTTITPTAYSFNQTAGQSVLAYTGNGTNPARIAHGLGAAPSFIMIKDRDGTNPWSVYIKGNGNTARQEMDNTEGLTTSSGNWADTDPDSVNFTVGANTMMHQNATGFFCFCATNKQGYFRTDSFKGNGDANGTYVYIGFKPAFIIVKKADTAEWRMYTWENRDANSDIEGSGLGHRNPVEYFMTCDQVTAEATSGAGSMDQLSDGFKFRHDNDVANGDNETYNYMAWAEAPLVSSNNMPTQAR